MSSHQIGVCSWSLQPTDPESLVSGIQKCGVHAVQLALGPVTEDPDWFSCHRILLEADICVLSGMFATVGEDYSSLETIAATGGVRPNATWKQTRELALRTSEIAKEMGLQLVTFHAGFLPHDESVERTTMMHRLCEIADLFCDSGMQLAFETGQETAETLEGVLNELAHPAVGVNFDPANMILYDKGDPVEAIQRLEPWVRQVHIKDAVASSSKGEWGTEVPVGLGDVHWPAFLASVPPDVALVVEREAGDNRCCDIRSGISFLQEMLS